MENRQPVKLDETDRKILLVLLKNGRIQLTELAKIINSNYPNVRNRVIKLVEKGVIRYFYPVTQVIGLGVRRYMSVYLSLKNITKEKQQKIIKKLCENPYLIDVSELEGRWNLSLSLVTNYLKESYETLNFIQELCGDYLDDLVAMPIFRTQNINRKFFTDIGLDVKNITTGYAPLINKTPLVHLSQKLKLSEEDVKILDYIKLNARAQRKEIGKNLGIDHTLVDYRIKKMISDNLIKYFATEINPGKLGYEQYLLFLNLGGDERNKVKLIEELETLKGTYHYCKYLNYWELVVTFVVKNRDEMHEIFNSLKEKYEGVIKNHEVLWLIRKRKKEPYPSVKKIYAK